MINENLLVCSKRIDLFTTVKGNEHSKKVIVALHGGPGNSSEPLIKSEAFKRLEKDFIMVYFDQRGCGKSDYNLLKPLKEEDVALDVHNVVKYAKDRFTNKDIYLWGGDFGGFLGFIYLKYYGDEVEKFVSTCPVMFFNDSEFSRCYENIIKQYSVNVPQNVKGLFNNMDVTSNNMKLIMKNKAVENFIFSSDCKSNKLRYAWSMSEWFFNERMGNTLSKVNIPVLIMQGKDDNYCDYYNILNGYNNYGNKFIKFKGYDNCGHDIWKDKKVEFIKDIKEFFTK